MLGAVALGTAACTPYSLGGDHTRSGDSTKPAATQGPRTDPDVALAATVLGAEQGLVDRVDATVAAHPRLEVALAGTREIHAAHVALLADAAPDGPTPSPTASPSTEVTGSASPPGADPSPRVPRDPARALVALARHEDELSLADRRSAFAAESGAFARVLASMAAAAAQQSAALRSTEAPGRRR